VKFDALARVGTHNDRIRRERQGEFLDEHQVLREVARVRAPRSTSY
jgi:hypothetical protein